MALYPNDASDDVLVLIFREVIKNNSYFLMMNWTLLCWTTYNCLATRYAQMFWGQCICYQGRLSESLSEGGAAKS